MNLQRSCSNQQIPIYCGRGAYPAALNLLTDDEWLECCVVAGAADPSRLHIPQSSAASKSSKSTPCSPSYYRKHITSHPASPVEPIRPSGCTVISGKTSKSHPSSPSVYRKLFAQACSDSPLEPICTTGGTMTTVGKSLFPPLGAFKCPEPPLTPPTTPICKKEDTAAVREKERLLLKEMEYHRWEMEDLLHRAEDAKIKKLFLAEAYYGQLADLHFQAIEKAGYQGDASNMFCLASR